MDNNSAIHRVAVIGAGISGILAAAHIISEGLEVTVFERASVSGGVWVWDPRAPLEPAYSSSKASLAETTFHESAESHDEYILHAGPGPCYDDLKNNVPTELLQVSLNAWKPNTESFVNHRVIAEYIQSTASKTAVTDRTLFNTKVERTTKEGRGWSIQTRTWDHITRQTTSENWTFDAVVVASGHYNAPSIPRIPGLTEWKTVWPSRIQHSKGYRNSKGFEDKTVLLIGGSASASDVAKELSLVARKVWQSTRGGEFDLPASSLPENVTRIGEIAQFGVLQTGHPRGSSGGAIPGAVTLMDGQVLNDIDHIIVATGYQFSFPYLSEYHRDDQSPEQADDQVLVTDGSQLHNLHKDIFYIPDPTLTFIGVPFFTATFSLFEFQAIAVAAFLAGKAKLPSELDMRAELRQRVEEKGSGKKFHSLWGNDVAYAAELMAWVNQGRRAEDKKPAGYSPEWVATKERLIKLAHPKNILSSGFEMEP